MQVVSVVLHQELLDVYEAVRHGGARKEVQDEQDIVRSNELHSPRRLNIFNTFI